MVRCDLCAYDKLVTESLRTIETGSSAEELRLKTMPLVQSYIQRSLRTTSDRALVRFGKLIAAEYRALDARGGSHCFDYMMGRDPSAVSHAASLIPPELRAEEFETQADVLEAANTVSGGRVVARARKGKELLATAVAQVGPDMAVLAELDRPEVDKAKACRTFARLVEVATEMPQDEAGAVLLALIVPAE